MRCGHVLRSAVWLCACSALAVGVAGAQTVEPSNRTDEMSFMAADTNGDGLVDEAELAADQAKRFKRLDANGDGFLTPDELETHEAIAFAAIDASKDDKISFAEAMSAKMSAFARADTNHDGRISWEEIVVFEGQQ